MTHTEFKAALAALGWNQSDAARHLGVTLRTISRYANGHIPVRRPVELVMKEALRWRASPTRKSA